MHRTGRIAVATFVSLACVGLAVEAEAVPTGIGTCRTINQPGSYVLRRNLTSAGTCLVVNADFVTIDLNGFVIAGDGTGVGVTDNSVTRRGTVIHGGSITNFAVGILMDISSGTHVHHMRVVGNAGAGIVVDAGSTVTDNIANGNLDGIILSVSGSTVRDNITYGNANAGMIVSCPSNIIGNTSMNNSGGGLIMVGAGCNSSNNVIVP